MSPLPVRLLEKTIGRRTTSYVTVTWAVWPTPPITSAACTVNVFIPTDAVSIGAPGATGPLHVAAPAPLSGQV